MDSCHSFHPQNGTESYKHKLTKHLMEILLMHDVLTRVLQRFASTNGSRLLSTEWEGRISRDDSALKVFAARLVCETQECIWTVLEPDIELRMQWK